MRSLAGQPPLRARLAYYMIGWRPQGVGRTWAEAFVLSDAWPLLRTAQWLVSLMVASIIISIVDSQPWSWEAALILASLWVLPAMLLMDRDIQRRREIARLRGLLSRPPYPLFVFCSIVAVQISLLRRWLVVGERTHWMVHVAVVSSIMVTLAWSLKAKRRYDRMLPPLPSKPVRFAES